MYSKIIFVLTLLQTAIIAGSYYLQWSAFFLGMVVYGSPFYLMMTMLGEDSAFLDTHPIYLGILGFHAIKYFVFFRAQMLDDANWKRNCAIVMEAAYLILTGYYLN
jgi:hypothetical protein